MMIVQRKKNSFFKKNLFLVFVGYALAISANIAFAVDVVINQPTTISESDQNYEFSSVVVDGVEVVINGSHQFQRLEIINGGVITHDAGERLELHIIDTLEINHSSINVGGKGLLADEFSALYSGGSHAGFGGAPAGTFAGFPYGDFQQPVTAGRGGRNGSLLIDDSTSNRGGGIIKINAAVLKMNAGYITAYGTGNYGGLATESGAGAGGSIWIDANKIITVEGEYSKNSINADGGKGMYYSDSQDLNHWLQAGNGSGGRVSISYSSLEAFGYVDGQEELVPNDEEGIKFLDITAENNYQLYSNAPYAASGTVFIKNKTTLDKRLSISSADGIYYGEEGNSVNNDYAYTPLNNIPRDIKLHLSRSKVKSSQNIVDNEIEQGIGSLLVFTEDVLINNLQSAEDVASLDAPYDAEAYGAEPACLNILFQKNVMFSIAPPCGSIAVGGQIQAPNNEVIANKLRLILRHSKTYSFGSLDLKNHSSIVSPRATNNLATPLELIADNIKIDETSSINVSGAGIELDFEQVGYNGGFGHGGRGKIDAEQSNSWFDSYGEYDEPITFGVGGNHWGDSYAGGAVKIVAKNLLLNGVISASSLNRGSAGGSIWLDVDNISVTAADPRTLEDFGYNQDLFMARAPYVRIFADAYLGGSNLDSSGGRVAIYYKTLTGIDLNTQVSTYGYSPGTLYLKRKDGQEPGLLIVNNFIPADGFKNNVITEIAIKNASDRASVTNARLRLSNFSNLDFLVNLKNSQIIFPDDASINLFPAGQNSELYFQGNLSLGGSLQSPAEDLQILRVAGTLSAPDGNLTIDGYTLMLANSHIFNSLEIKNGGVFTTERASGVSPQVFNLTAETIKIDAASKIDVSGKGLGFAENSGLYAGGSHGGAGGMADVGIYDRGQPSEVYGDLFSPESFGRGSKIDLYNYPNTYGGGAIKIIATSMQLEGSILANGEPVEMDQYNYSSISGGGAAGGSVWLDIDNLFSTTGTSIVTARGSAGVILSRSWTDLYSGAGGGGRIFIDYESINGINNVDANGGINPAPSAITTGAAGTVVFSEKSSNPGEQKIRIAGSGATGDYKYQNLSQFPANTHVVIEKSSLILNDAVALTNISFIDSKIILAGDISLTGTMTVSGTQLNVNNAFSSVGSTINIENNSNVNVGSSGALAGTINITDSAINFSAGNPLTQLNANNANINFYSDAVFSGGFNLINSAMRVYGDLQAGGISTLQMDTGDIKIAHFSSSSEKEYIGWKP